MKLLSMARWSLKLKAGGPAVSSAKRPVISNLAKTPHRRCASTTSTDSVQPPRRRPWLQLTALTAATIGVGAYIRSYYDPANTTLNSVGFTEYEIVSKTPVSLTSCIFTLRPLQEGSNWEVYQAAWQKGLWSVQFKQPQLQIGRDYTPLPPLSSHLVHDLAWDEVDEVDGTLKFLIRKDPRGEVSGYLHSLNPGDTVELRGPQMEYPLPPDVQEVLFIAGGTGIAPALQAAHTIYKSRGQGIHTRMHVLWANRRRADCVGGHSDLAIPSSGSWWSRLVTYVTGTAQEGEEVDGPLNITVAQLEDLKAQYPGIFTVDYFVDEEGTLIDEKSVLKFTNSRNPKASGSSSKSKLILISGPDGFVSYLAGPKTLREGGVESQGPLQGLLRQLDLKDWTVWKL